MLKISGTKISLTRGDSAYITLHINMSDGSPYEVQENDIIKCQVRDKVNDGNLIFEGTIEKINDEIVWHIRPEDTKNEEVTNYVWDAQIELENGDVFTFIPTSAFRLMDEVTMEG